jgi:GT2 family glycosyltransferase/spore maturation protein CgeB/SAM-dependent methyltransferase
VEYDGERLIPGIPGLQRLEVEHLGRYRWAVQFAGGRKVIDAGSGMGYGAALLAQTAASVLGVDVHKEAVEEAKALYGSSARLDFITADLEAADLSLPPADLIVMFEVIEHLHRPAVFLDCAARSLGDQGVLLLSTPNFERFSRTLEKHNPHHHADYRTDDLERILTSHFRHVRVEPQYVWLASAIGQPDGPFERPGSGPSDSMFLVAMCSQSPLPPSQPATYVDHDRITHLLSERLRRMEESRDTLREQNTELQARYETIRREHRDARQQLSEVGAQLEAATAERDRAIAGVKALESKTGTIRRSLDKAQRDLDRLRSRRAVRLSLSAAALFRPVFRAVRRIRNRPKPTHDAASTESSERSQGRSAAGRLATVRKARPDRGRVDGPLVSLIVPTRDGLHHLERLFPALTTNTTYRSFEVIVVDNGSVDGSLDYVKGDWPFPVQVIRNEVNRSFSEANNQGVAAARGDLILLLNNDTEPVNAGWLGSMVDELTASEDTLAVGALLIYSKRTRDDAEATHPPFSVQHRGIGFIWRDGSPRAVNLGGGEDPTNPSLVGSATVPAATAACLLTRKKTYEEVGGLDEGYVYGTEDVDFCLKLRERGGIIRMCGGAALLHHEFGTQDELSHATKRINRMGNAQRFAEKWAPRLARSMRADGFSPKRAWTETTGRKVAITLTEDDPTAGWGDWYTAHELGEALSRLGWEVVYAERLKDRWYELADDVNLVISLLDGFDIRRAPAGAVTIAWIRNWLERWMERPWFGHFDEVAVSSTPAAEYVDEQLGYRPLVLPLATNPERFVPGPATPTFASDFTFTGNHWGQNRKLLDDLLLRPDERFMIFGKGWDSSPRAQRYWRGHLEYDQLPLAYQSASVVLDDTAGPTLPFGFVNARVFDALAAGALVITDNVAGSGDLFDGELPAYRDRSDLRALMDEYTQDPRRREALAKRLREKVLAAHTYDHRARAFLDMAGRAVGRPRVALKIGPPSWDVAEAWGDTHFARHFATALGGLGFSTALHVLPEWDRPDKQDFDVVIHVRGLTPYVPKPAHMNVLWIISHPDDVSPEECERYDLVLVASPAHAGELRTKVSVPVHVLLQATDIARFHPDVHPGDTSHDLLFVGNSRGHDRHGVRWAVEAGLPLTVYGGDWEGRLNPSVVRGRVPNDDLPALYRSASILLNDHWEDMRQKGFVSNRVFDALACGTFVISDDVAGLEDLFDGAVPTYANQEELKELVARYLHDEEGRHELSERGAAIVRTQHSFQVRAHQFVDLIQPRLANRSAEIEPRQTIQLEPIRHPTTTMPA